MPVKQKPVFVLMVLIAALSINASAQSTMRPNIVIIFMDDMGYGDPECYSGVQYSTPNINRLAAQGMRFTNFYSAQAVCTASRAGLLTGCYPNRLGIYGAFFPWTAIALNPKETTIASMLKEAGYKTGMVGKWHLGAEAPYLPLNYGFDEYLGLPYSNDMWPLDDLGKPVNDSNVRFYYPPLPLIDGNKAVKQITSLEEQAELTTLYTRKATGFIDKNKNKPFFLYLAHSMPHVPIAASEKFRGKSERGLFGDVMIELDWSVGEVMNALKKNDLEKNTLLIFTSDNGPWLTYGNHAGNTGGLREGKGTTFEGGQREPCIVRWPSKIAAGTVCNKITSAIDLLPTIAAACGVKVPSNKIDGINVLSLLLGEPNANPRKEFVYYYHQNSLEAIRKGKWKLIFPHRSVTYKDQLPGKDGTRAGWRTMDVELALYDLSTDPGETLDLQMEYPEVVNELKQLADSYRARLGDDLTNVPCTECRPAAAFIPSTALPPMLRK
ncbi:MAG: sulfatase [Chitinophagaceae bacterium]|nr:sulfatase [Chitinophagaceae bacterium]